MNKNKNQGRWQYEVNIDLPPFISYRFEKGKQLRNKYEEKKKLKQKAESDKNLGETKKAAERKQAEAKKRQEVLLKQMAARSNKTPATTPTKSPTVSPEQAIESALMRHQDSVFKLLAASAARGERVVPNDLIFSARKATTAQLNLLSSSMKRFTGKSISEIELSEKIGNAESAAVKQYTEHLRRGMH